MANQDPVPSTAVTCHIDGAAISSRVPPSPQLAFRSMTCPQDQFLDSVCVPTFPLVPYADSPETSVAEPEKSDHDVEESKPQGQDDLAFDSNIIESIMVLLTRV